MSNAPVITIDGPSGSGKGTIARLVAEALAYHLLDSGALYRLTAYAATKQGVALDDANALGETAKNMPVSFRADADGVVPLYDDLDVGTAIRNEACGEIASKLAALPEVRAALLERQRRFLTSPGLVADGRDMGTVVFPDAKLKIFLTASAEERAKRRHQQLKQRGLSVNLRDLSCEIAQRDERDAKRAVSPLVPAEDAILIDSTQLSVADVKKQILELAAAR